MSCSDRSFASPSSLACRRIKLRLLVPILVPMLVAMVLTSAGCTTTKPAVDDRQEQVEPQTVRPGAESWQRHALLLPADAPVVFWARSHALFDGLEGLRDWLLAEPAMFGPNGEQMIAQANRGWNAAIAYLGMDPLSAASWEKLGLDTERDVYMGVYPVEDGQGDGFVRAFDGAVREALELDADTNLLSALDTMAMLGRGELPRGLHTSVATTTGDHEPILGVRMVVPVADESAMLENVDRLMRGAEYVQVDEGETDGRSYYFFYDLEGSWPGILLRAGEDTAIFDIIAKRPGPRQAPGSGEQRQAAVTALRARLADALESVTSGRPAAPKPPGTPAVGIAVDQEGAADLAKLRGYRTALERAEISAVGERDALFLQDVHSSLKSARNWEVASGKLSGVSYGLFTGAEADAFFRIGVTLFGAREDADLAVSPAPVSLGVDRRGLGMSLDLLPLSDAHWQSFVGVTNPGQVVDNFTAADYDPGLFALSFPRNLAVLFANSEKIFEEHVTESMEPMLEGSEALRRLEIASAGIDMRGLRIQPRMVGLILLDDQAEPETRQKLADAVGEALSVVIEAFEEPEQASADTSPPAKMAREDSAEAQTSADKTPADKSPSDKSPSDKSPSNETPSDPRDVSFSIGKLIELRASDTSAPVFYYADPAGKTPYLFFSYGLAREASQGELDKLSSDRQDAQQNRPAAQTFSARAEPVALFSLLTLFEPHLFEPLDVSILAQRLGALVFSVEPEEIDGVQTIRYDFSLERPPRLE